MYPDGEHVSYKSLLPLGNQVAGNGVEESFLATRTSTGWRQQAVSASQGSGPATFSLGEQQTARGALFTNDYSEALFMSPFRNPLENPVLNDSTGIMVYDRSLATGTTTTVSLPDSGELTQEMIEFPAAYKSRSFANGWGMVLAGASQSGSRVFFITTAKLATTPGTPQDTHEMSNELYERSSGHTYLVGVLPNGEVPECGAEAGQGQTTTAGENSSYTFGAIAPSGENVVFRTPGNQPGVDCHEKEKGVFLRNVVTETTVELPGNTYAGRTGTGPGEEEIIFTTTEAGNIYAYHVTSGQIVDITSGSDGLLAYSANGDRVYYLGPEEGIYLYEEGGPPPRLIPGTQEEGYLGGEYAGGVILTNEVTDWGHMANMPVTAADGTYLLFISPAKLSAYENEGRHEAYVYDANTNEVTCISCNLTGDTRGPTGEPLQGEASLIEKSTLEADRDTPYAPLLTISEGSGGSGPVVTATFATTESLIPQDTNGTTDVYEWEMAGTEGCDSKSLGIESLAQFPAYSALDDGCVFLLSSGTGEEVPNQNGVTNGSHLAGAGEGLRNIFVDTAESLLPEVDNSAHIYDVRSDGGFPFVAASHGCEPGACKVGNIEAPGFEEPGSIGFNGPGNIQAQASEHVSTGKSRGKKSTNKRQRELRVALARCRKHHGHQGRSVCERAARRRYGKGRSMAHGRRSK